MGILLVSDLGVRTTSAHPDGDRSELILAWSDVPDKSHKGKRDRTIAFFSRERRQQIFGCDIATEEERTRVFDRSDARYSILARTLAVRQS
jgi:hypothetical protein